ncbi:MAG: NAD(P)H-dependent oxidoreductase, partial [Bdellovibrio sp.]|nr:NAD(P)H-dependent oxidoreductase [Bdellovibrio sp.]
MNILILNGSVSGKTGNCHRLIQKLIFQLKQIQNPKKKELIQVVHLSEIKWTPSEKKKLFSQIKKADGFVFATGTYWDSWGSPLQKFLENVTDLEGGPAFLGKPAAVFVLNHSVGGKGVLSRLQGVLSTFGCLIPPMCGMVYAWVSQQVSKGAVTTDAAEDLWSLDDIDTILKNFTLAMTI